MGGDAAFGFRRVSFGGSVVGGFLGGRKFTATETGRRLKTGPRGVIGFESNQILEMKQKRHTPEEIVRLPHDGHHPSLSVDVADP